MHSAVIVLSLLAGSVLSQPAHHGHGHLHARQDPVEVIDVVDVYTTVIIDGPAPPQATPPPATHAKKPVEHTSAPAPAPAPEEKLAEPVHEKPAVVSTPPPAPPTSSSAPPPPPPSSAAAAPAAAPSSGNTFLDVHNQKRADHGAVPMTWDDSLASKAQSEVSGCPSDDVQAGSNWYGSSGSESQDDAANGAISGWYGEMSLYAQRTNNYVDNPPSNLPSNAPETGHFSQMVWNASTSLGCGVATSCSGWATQVICLYEPAGNMVFNGQPQYTENVFPPK